MKLVTWLREHPVVALAALCVVLALVLVASERRARRAEAEVARLDEAAALQGRVIVSEQQGKVRAQLELADAQEALRRAQAAAPGAQVVEVHQLRTAELVAGGAPRGTGSTSPGAPGEAPVLDPAPPPAGHDVQGGTSCLLADGDRGDLRVEVAELRTKAGNLVVTGAAEAWRLEPGPATRILSGPFEARLSSSVVERQPGTEPGPGWGIGVMGGGGLGGWFAGPAVAPPPLHLGGKQADFMLGVVGGPAGLFFSAAGVLR